VDIEELKRHTREAGNLFSTQQYGVLQVSHSLRVRRCLRVLFTPACALRPPRHLHPGFCHATGHSKRRGQEAPSPATTGPPCHVWEWQRRHTSWREAP
jgi:hypothetical protein